MIENATEEGTVARTRFGISWLIVKDDVGAGCGSPEVLTLGPRVDEDGWTLPVFSFEEEAMLFLRLCGFDVGWRVSKNGISDLASVISDARPDIRQVALDPIPEIGAHGPHDLVSLPRETFVRMLAAG